MRVAPWLLFAILLPLAPDDGDEPNPDAGFETIREDDVGVHLRELASPQLEGRDTPSEGLELAALYIEERLRAAGFEPLGEEGSYRMPYTIESYAPVEARTSLRLDFEGEAPADLPELEFEKTYVPLPRCNGDNGGEVVFCGFGITGAKERYDDLKGVQVKGKVALILAGEPNHKRLFDGPEISEAADLYGKLSELEDAGVAGVLVVRRPPAERVEGLDGEEVQASELGFRYSWATWNPSTTKPMKRWASAEFEFPVLEITHEVGSAILGEDILELAATIESKGKPVKIELEGVRAEMKSAFQRRDVRADNVVGVMRGTDAALAEEFLVLGAHYDHIGVDAWGRIGYGADDNASGTAALLELVEAFGSVQPRRSVVAAFFSGEEDGLIGSRAFCDEPPVARDAQVAMLNMDMVGRGKASEVVVLGTKENPELEKVLKEAKKLKPTKIKKVITGKAEQLWERSDHFSFHRKGIPTLFFFEAVSETDNADYHTFRDTIERLDADKITRTARFVFNTAWLIANDDERPPPPR